MQSSLPHVRVQITAFGPDGLQASEKSGACYDNPAESLVECLGFAEQRVPCLLDKSPLLVNRVSIDFEFEDALPRGTAALHWRTAIHILAGMVPILATEAQ